MAEMPQWFVDRMNELTAEEDPSRAEREYWLPGNPPPAAVPETTEVEAK